MALFLLPIFVVAFFYTAVAIIKIKNQSKMVFAILIGFIVMLLSFPVVITVLNGIFGGMIQKQLKGLWSITESLTIANGDIYIGGIGLVIVVFSIVLIILQVVLTRSRL